MQELLEALNTAKSVLTLYYNIHKNENFLSTKNNPKDYLDWINTKTKIIINSPNFIK